MEQLLMLLMLLRAYDHARRCPECIRSALIQQQTWRYLQDMDRERQRRRQLASGYHRYVHEWDVQSQDDVQDNEEGYDSSEDVPQLMIRAPTQDGNSDNEHDEEYRVYPNSSDEEYVHR